MVMQLPKGAKVLITAILALVIAFLKHRSKKAKPTPALTNSPVSNAPKVSTAPEPVAQKEQPRKGEQQKEEQPCKEVAKEAQKKVEEPLKEEHKKEEKPCKEVAKEEQKKEEDPGNENPKEELKKEQPCKEIEGNEEQTREEVVASQVPDDKDLVYAEVNIGEKVLYTDGEVGVIHEFDNDGDVIVRKFSDGKTATWFADKCAKAEITIGDSVRHSCGERARVDSFDPDGDVTVLKTNGAKTIWYKSKTTGVPIKMSNFRKNTSDAISMAGVVVGA